jgi:hypothetical protein
MKKGLFLVALMLIVLNANAQSKSDVWNEFARTKFDPKYDEKLKEYFFAPAFSTSLKKMEGKEIALTGFYVPFSAEEGDYIIISRVPMSQCFFCGGSGPESIAEVYFLTPQTRFKVDDVLNVRGKLKLNAEDPEHVNFIVTEAVLVKE